MSGDLQKEKRDHEKKEHEEVQEPMGPALPPRQLSIDEPNIPPEEDLPGPGADTGGNELLSTIEPAAFDFPVAASDSGGGDGGGGGGGGGSEGGASAPSSK